MELCRGRARADSLRAKATFSSVEGGDIGELRHLARPRRHLAYQTRHSIASGPSDELDAASSSYLLQHHSLERPAGRDSRPGLRLAAPHHSGNSAGSRSLATARRAAPHRRPPRRPPLPPRRRRRGLATSAASTECHSVRSVLAELHDGTPLRSASSPGTRVTALGEVRRRRSRGRVVRIPNLSTAASTSPTRSGSRTQAPTCERCCLATAIFSSCAPMGRST